jgi:hypothetical protein
VAAVREDPDDAQTARSRNGLGQREQRFAGRGAASPEPRVHLQHDVERHTAGRGRLSEGGRDVHAVDADAEPDLSGKREQARQFRPSDDLVGEEDIVHPGARHHFGLADLGEREAAGAGRELAAGDLHALVRFAVGAKFDAGVAGVGRPTRDVGVEAVQIDDERRRVQGLDPEDRSGGCGHSRLPLVARRCDAAAPAETVT